MVVFKEFATSIEKYLVIVDHEGDDMENGTKLLTHDAMHGNYIGDWPSHDFAHVDEWSSEVQLDEDVAAYSLKSLIHTEKPRTTSFQTLGSRIISGEAHWGSTLKLNGEFGFIQNYWEWLEDILGRNKDGLRDTLLYEALYASLFTYDRNPNIIRAFCEAWCPETNTLHTSIGELSLSLWDLQKLGGLPIVGGIYEEVIPCATELTGVDKDNYRFIPHSCEYLFAAFHHLQHEESDKSSILAAHWIDFWFRGKSRYSKPKPRRLRKASRPQSTQNPDGEIGQPGKLSTQSKSAFKIIGVKSHLKEETYLAAFISCWLCVFALPNEYPCTIRPTTFKVASLMAAGRKTCLAVPVLLSIYRGLNKIAKSQTPGHSNTCFPVHYVHAWLAQYFSTHYMSPTALPAPAMTNYSGEGGARFYDENEARDIIHNGDQLTWSATSLVKNRHELFVDNGRLSHEQLGYFIGARSNYLTLHTENRFLVEPYNPYRVSRQFGFYQDIPNELGADVRNTNYELCRTLWRTLIRYKTNAKMLFPAYPPDANQHVSPSFRTWWRKTHGKHLSKGKEALLSSLQPNTEHKKPKGKEIATIIKSSKGNDPQEPKSKKNKSKRGETKAHISKESSPKNTSRRLPSLIIKAKDSKTASSNEKKMTNSYVEEDDHSHNSDRHWKRKKNKLDDLSLVYIEENEASQGSVEGPNAFDLLAKQVAPSPHLEDIGDSAKQKEHDDNPTQKLTSQPTVDKQKKLKVFDPPTWPKAPQISEFCPKALISSCRRDYIQMLWNNLSVNISQTPLERMSSLEKKADEVIEEMCSSNIMDLSHLHGLLKAFFANVTSYSSVKSTLAEKIPAESHEELLTSTARRLKDAKSIEKKQAAKISSHMTTLTNVDREEAELKDQLAKLDAQRKETLSLVQEDQEELSQVQAGIAHLKEELRRIGNSTPLSPEDSETLEKMEKLLETNRQELSHFEL